MPTFGDSLHDLDEQFFVGRQREIEFFRSWLTAEHRGAGVINVSGPGGVGKSALLRMFQRIALALGWLVVLVDGRLFRATIEGLLQVLGGTDVQTVIAQLNHSRPLLIFDTSEEFENLTPFLRDTFLPQLDAGIPIVIAGRLALGLAWSGQWAWHQVIRPLPIQAFEPDEGQAYLARRGVSQPAVVERILAATAGHPLALALATDLALQFGVRQFRPTTEWSRALNVLLERLLLDIRDPQLRALIEAAAVVPEFDEALLRALAGDPAMERAFDRLCRLSMVRPSPRALTLHDAVRRIVTDDLQARQPSRYRELRLRALTHYRQRARAAPPAEQERFLAARYALWENILVQTMLVSAGDRGDVWVEPGAGHDHAAVQQIWRSFCETVLPTLMPVNINLAAEYAWLETIVGYPGTRLRIARGVDGETLGFSTMVPLCQASLPLLEDRLRASILWRAATEVSGNAVLPATAGESRAYCLIHIAAAEKQTAATRVALARDLFSVLASSGLYLAHTPVVGYKQLFETMGWRCVPVARHYLWGPDSPSDGYVLDLQQVGVEAWIESLLDQGPALPTANPTTTEAPAALTKREREIIELIARGLSNQMIADELVLSVRTVERHIENAYAKFGLHGKGARGAIASVALGNSGDSPPA